MTKYYCGLDLGQASDHSALVIAEKIEPAKKQPPEYHIRHLQRFPLGTSYPQIVTHIKAMLEREPLKENVRLALDYTGVGRPVADMFEVSDAGLSCFVHKISIHGGDAVQREGMTIRVPKRDLVAVVQVLLQSGRLQIADALPEAKTLEKELLNFRVKIDPATAHDSYSAWRENIHDDLVLAVALACWLAEHGNFSTVW
jgi:hypothetical protein